MTTPPDTVKVPNTFNIERERQAFEAWAAEEYATDRPPIAAWHGWQGRAMCAAAPPQPEPGWQEGVDAMREAAATCVETHLVRHYEKQHGQTRGNSEVEYELARAIRALPAPPKETKT